MTGNVPTVISETVCAITNYLLSLWRTQISSLRSLVKRVKATTHLPGRHLIWTHHDAFTHSKSRYQIIAAASLQLSERREATEVETMTYSKLRLTFHSRRPKAYVWDRPGPLRYCFTETVAHKSASLLSHIWLKVIIDLVWHFDVPSHRQLQEENIYAAISRGFSEAIKFLGRIKNILIENQGVGFKLAVPTHDKYPDLYVANVNRFLWEAADRDKFLFSALDIHSTSSTAVTRSTATPSQFPSVSNKKRRAKGRLRLSGDIGISAPGSQQEQARPCLWRLVKWSRWVGKPWKLRLQRKALQTQIPLDEKIEGNTKKSADGQSHTRTHAATEPTAQIRRPGQPIQDVREWYIQYMTTSTAPIKRLVWQIYQISDIYIPPGRFRFAVDQLTASKPSDFYSFSDSISLSFPRSPDFKQHQVLVCLEWLWL